MLILKPKLVATVALLATSGLIALSYAQAPASKEVTPAKPQEAAPAKVPDTPETILARMVKTYGDATSYEDEGEAVLVFKDNETKSKRTVKRPFLTKFVRPKLFRYEYSERNGDGDDERKRYVIWTKDAAEGAKTWWTIQPEVQENPLDLAVGAAVGVSAGTSQTVPALLMPKALSSRGSLGWLVEPRLVGEEMVDKALCYKIEGQDSSGNPETTWVDKETHLLKKMFAKTLIPGHTVEQTTTYRPKINVEITAEQFDFEPPKP